MKLNMKNFNHNIRKKQILAILSYTNTPYTSREIADLCPVSLSCVCALLKRYVQHGLIKRKKENDKFIYSITPIGLERLEFLLGSKSVKERIDLLVRETLLR